MSGFDAALGEQMVNTAMDTLVGRALDCVEANKTASLGDALRVCEQAMSELIRTDAVTCYRSSNAKDAGQEAAWSDIQDARNLACAVLAKVVEP